MRLAQYVAVTTLFGTTIANAIQQPGAPDARLDAREEEQHLNGLHKRKGGGGGGARGGGGGGRSSGSGSRGGSTGSRTSPKGSTGGSSGGSSGSRGSSSGSGSAPSRSFGGGKFYGGGAATPFKAGSRSPKGISPGPLLAVGVAALLIWPATWAYGAYHYNYANPYRFHNDTANEDEELNVICGCDPYNPCGCDENDDDAYLDDLVGDGDYSTLDKDVVTVAQVDGETTLLINGTLSNDTIQDESAAYGTRSNLEALGWWPVVAVVVGTVYMA